MPTEQPIRVLLVDDHALMRTGLRMLIDSRSTCRVVAEVGSAEEALDAAAREQPDVILLDLDLGGESGLDCLPRLTEACPAAKVLVVTGLRNQEAHRRAIALGALGIVLKDQTSEVILKAIDCVHHGEVWIDRALMAQVVTEMSQARARSESDPERARIASLTEREREVITMAAQGLRNRDIARRLFISEATVRHHLTSIYGKLGVADRLELVIYAFRHGLAQVPKG